MNALMLEAAAAAHREFLALVQIGGNADNDDDDDDDDDRAFDTHHMPPSVLLSEPAQASRATPLEWRRVASPVPACNRTWTK